MAHVVVIGAGVIGLQTAATLLEADYQVTIIAKHWPGDVSIEYCSPWAGAIWRTHASPKTETSEWDLLSYKIGMQIAQDDPEEAHRMGLMQCPITIFTDDQPPWYAEKMQDFAIMPAEQLPPNTSKHGYSFAAIAINPLTYLSHLLAEVKAKGVRPVTAKIPSLQHLLENFHDFIDTGDLNTCNLVVNCTGLSAKSFCGDDAMYPISGQTLLARIHPIPKQEILLWESSDHVTYVVPRPGTQTFILGGTKTANSYDSEPNAEISEAIVERCKRLLKDEVRVEVVAEQVGLRPGRQGGPRVELEKMMVD